MEYLSWSLAKLQDAAATYRSWNRSGLINNGATEGCDGGDGGAGPAERASDAVTGEGIAAADPTPNEGGVLYVSSILANIGLSVGLFFVAKVAHTYFLSRATRQRDRVILLKKVRAAVVRWEAPCLAEITDCLSIPRTAQERRETQQRLCDLLGKGMADEAEALMTLWASVAAAHTEEKHRALVKSSGGDGEGWEGKTHPNIIGDSSGSSSSSSSGGGGEQPQQGEPRDLTPAGTHTEPSARERVADASEAAATPGETVFHGMMASIAYASDFPLLTLGELCHTAKAFLTLDEDLRMVRRLECILQYVIFRRAAMLEEVCLHAHYWRRAVLLHRGPRGDGCGSEGGETVAAVPPLRKGCRIVHAWRVYGRPSWLVPIARERSCASAAWGGAGSGGAAAAAASTEAATRVRHYLSLPHSYFPLEALQVMTTQWFNGFNHTILPQFNRDAPGELAAIARAVASDSTAIGKAPLRSAGVGEKRRAAAQSATLYWFLAFASPLIEQMKRARHRLMCERNREKLFRGVHCSTGRGADELLFDCGASRLTRARPTSRFGVRGVFQSSQVQRRLHTYLALRGLLCMVSAVVALGGGDRYWRAASFVTVAVVRHVAPSPATYSSSSSLETVSSLPSTASPSAAASQSSRSEELLSVLLGSFAYSTLSLVASRAVDHMKSILRDRIAAILAEGYAEEARAVMLNADDAFFQRAVHGSLRGQSTDAKGPSATFDQFSGVLEAAEKDYVVNNLNTLQSESKVWDALYYFDENVCSWLGFAVQSACVVYRGELLPLAVHVMFNRWSSFSEVVPVWLGVAITNDLRKGLRRVAHEALPSDSPPGLTLLLDILAEEEEEAETEKASGQGSAASATTAVRTTTAATSLRHPFLALVACSGVWEHVWLRRGDGEGKGSDDGDGAGKPEGGDGGGSQTGVAATATTATCWATRRRLFAVQRLYHKVARYGYAEALAMMMEQQQQQQQYGPSYAAPSLPTRHRAATLRLDPSPLPTGWWWPPTLSRWQAKRTLRRQGHARALAVVEALLEDVGCISYYEIDELCAKREAATRREEEGEEEGLDTATGTVEEAGGGMSDAKNGIADATAASSASNVARPVPGAAHHHPAMSPDEVAITHSSGYRRYLPSQLQCWDLFTANRFILKQLGLELVFAHRAVTNLEQNHIADKSFDLGALFNSPYGSPLESVMDALWDLLQSLALVATTSSVVTRAGWVMSPRPAWEVLLVNLHMSLYEAVTRKLAPQTVSRNPFNDIDFLVFAPATLGDGGAYSQGAEVRQRRRAWRAYLEAEAKQQQQQQRQRPRGAGFPAAARKATPRVAAVANADRLEFDSSDRIVGGFRMREGIELHHVFFTYPQLHHHHHHGRRCSSGTPHHLQDVEERADVLFEAGCVVKPVVVDACARFPAGAMTALVGRTGSGKSSLGKLLKRCYDPVPVVAVAWPLRHDSEAAAAAHPPARRSAADGVLRPDAATGTKNVNTHADAIGVGEIVGEQWTEQLLCDILWLQWIENPLPLPPSLPSATTTTTSTSTGADGTEWRTATTARGTIVAQTDAPFAFLPSHGLLTWDGLPVSCFSTNYLRRWLAHLDQHPAILQNMTFEDNIRYLSFDVTPGDVRHAAQLCQCSEFIHRSPLGLRSLVGTLSGGERQRLALARVVAGAKARVRRENCEASFAELHAGATFAKEWEEGSYADCDGVAEAEGGLLLDEPTSRLDAHNEMQVQASITRLLPHVGFPPVHRGRQADREGGTGNSAGNGVARDGGSNGSSMADDRKCSETASQLPTPPPPPPPPHGQVTSKRGSFVIDGAEVTEREEDERLPALMIISIAHRMATLQTASHMVVMEEGRVVCQGPTAHVRATNTFVQQQLALQDLRAPSSSSSPSPHPAA